MTVISRAVPEGIDDEFAASKDKQRQWAAFVGREPLHIVVPSLQESLSEIANFALPPLGAAASDADFDMVGSMEDLGFPILAAAKVDET